MALNAAVTSDNVSFGSAASLDALDPFTVMLWVKPSALTSGRILWNKSTSAKRLRLNGTGGNVEVIVNRATTNTDYVTSNTPLSSTSTWAFVGVVFNSAASAGEVVNIYVGTDTVAVAECTYGTATDGSGTLTDDSASNFQVAGGGSAMFGDYAAIHVCAAALSSAQVESQRQSLSALASSRLLAQMGYPTVTDNTDTSGSGNNGTTSGMTFVTHPSFLTGGGGAATGYLRSMLLGVG